MPSETQEQLFLKSMTKEEMPKDPFGYYFYRDPGMLPMLICIHKGIVHANWFAPSWLPTWDEFSDGRNGAYFGPFDRLDERVISADREGCLRDRKFATEFGYA